MTGLVLEGGANRAYFSAGAMDAMLDLGVECDYIIGVSAGISNGVSYAAKQRGRCYKIGTEYANDKRYTGIKYLFDKSNKSYYNMNFVFDEVPNKHVPFDHQAFLDYKGRIYAGVTNIKTGGAEYFPVDRNDRKWTLLKASCALPVMFPPIEYNGELYMDGGVADPIPVKRAVCDGCDKVVAILTREREYYKKEGLSGRFSSGIFRKYPDFVKTLKTRHNIYNESKEYLFELEKQGKAFIIAPKSTKGWKRTDGSPDVIKGFYDLGYNFVKECEGEILDFTENKRSAFDLSYKGAVFFDYDGTLADEKEGIYVPTEKTKESIEKLRKNGYAAVLCTGRAMCYIAETDVEFDGYVTSNGAYTELFGKCVHNFLIEEDLMKKFVAAMDELDMFYSIETQDRCVVRDINNKEFLKMLDNFSIKIDNFRPMGGKDDLVGNKMMVAYENDEQIIKLTEMFKDEFVITGHRFNKSADIGRHGISKATGVRAAADYLKLDMDNVYAFGDGSNDYTMIACAGHGIAMGIHAPELEEVAEYITDTVKNEGITKALEKYGLI